MTAWPLSATPQRPSADSQEPSANPPWAPKLLLHRPVRPSEAGFRNDDADHLSGTLRSGSPRNQRPDGASDRTMSMTTIAP
jgi:hypothetical protein